MMTHRFDCTSQCKDFILSNAEPLTITNLGAKGGGDSVLKAPICRTDVQQRVHRSRLYQGRSRRLTSPLASPTHPPAFTPYPTLYLGCWLSFLVTLLTFGLSWISLVNSHRDDNAWRRVVSVPILFVAMVSPYVPRASFSLSQLTQ